MRLPTSLVSRSGGAGIAVSIGLALTVSGCATGRADVATGGAPALAEKPIIAQALAATRAETRAHRSLSFGGSCPDPLTGSPQKVVPDDLYNPRTGDSASFVVGMPCAYATVTPKDAEELRGRTRTVGDWAYSQPAPGQKLPGGMTWTASRRPAAHDDELDILTDMQPVADRYLVRLEETTVRGTQVTHYQADVPQQELDELTSPAPSQTGAALEVAVLRVQLWLDKEMRIRLIRLSNLATGAFDQPVDEREVQDDLTFELFDYGTAPAVLTPPREQVQFSEPLPSPTAILPVPGNLPHD